MAETKKPKAGTHRRNFLKLMGLGGVGGVAAAVAPASQAEAATAETPKGSGYRETEHVKTFYKLARF